MSNILALASRELRAYFYSVMGYVVIAVFLVWTGIFFGLSFEPGEIANLQETLNMSVLVLIAGLPIVTMRLVSEELSSGTIETLMTAPVTDVQVILGKFLGAMGFFLVMLVPTLVYPLILAIVSSPDFGPIAAGYLGLVLMGMLFVSIGLLTSVCTRAQMVSAFVSVVSLGILTLLTWFLAQRMSGWPRDLFRYVGFWTRYDNFTRGLITLNDVVFFVSLTALALFVSVKVLESRKWRG